MLSNARQSTIVVSRSKDDVVKFCLTRANQLELVSPNTDHGEHYRRAAHSVLSDQRPWAPTDISDTTISLLPQGVMAQDINRYLKYQISCRSYPVFYAHKLTEKFGASDEYFRLLKNNNKMLKLNDASTHHIKLDSLLHRVQQQSQRPSHQLPEQQARSQHSRSGISSSRFESSRHVNRRRIRSNVVEPLQSSMISQQLSAPARQLQQQTSSQTTSNATNTILGYNLNKFNRFLSTFSSQDVCILRKLLDLNVEQFSEKLQFKYLYVYILQYFQCNLIKSDQLKYLLIRFDQFPSNSLSGVVIPAKYKGIGQSILFNTTNGYRLTNVAFELFKVRWSGVDNIPEKLVECCQVLAQNPKTASTILASDSTFTHISPMFIVWVGKVPFKVIFCC